MYTSTRPEVQRELMDGSLEVSDRSADEIVKLHNGNITTSQAVIDLKWFLHFQ